MQDKQQFQSKLVSYDLGSQATFRFGDIVSLLDHSYILIIPILTSFISICISVGLIDTIIVESYSSPVSITLQQITIASIGFLVELLSFLLMDIVMFILGKTYSFKHMLRLQVVIYKYITIVATYILTFLSISTKISCGIQLLFLTILISEGAVSTYAKLRNILVPYK